MLSFTSATNCTHATLESDDNFTEMSGALHVVEGFLCLCKGEYPVDYRSDLVNCHGPIHRFKHLSRAHEYTLYPYALHCRREWVDLPGLTRKDSDQADMSAHANCSEGLSERPRATDLNHQVHAGSFRKFDHALFPFGYVSYS